MFCCISPRQHKEVMAVLLSRRIFIPSCLLHCSEFVRTSSYFVEEKPCSSFIIFLHLDNSFQLCSPAKLSPFGPMACSAMLSEKRVLILWFLVCGTFLLPPSNGQHLPSPKNIYWESTALAKYIFYELQSQRAKKIKTTKQVYRRDYYLHCTISSFLKRGIKNLFCSFFNASANTFWLAYILWAAAICTTTHLEWGSNRNTISSKLWPDHS